MPSMLSLQERIYHGGELGNGSPVLVELVERCAGKASGNAEDGGREFAAVPLPGIGTCCSDHGHAGSALWI